MSGLPSHCPAGAAFDGDCNSLTESSDVSLNASAAAETRQRDMLGEKQLQVVSYIEEISVGLRDMARAVQLDGLAYFIDMTRCEAAAQRRARERHLADEAG